MTIVENILKEIEKLKDQFEAGIIPYSIYGIRFDDRELNIGFIFGKSKSNPNRDDERDFPEYGTDEYHDLPELGGTCAYYAFDGDRGMEAVGLNQIIKNIEPTYTNWYLVGADFTSNDYAEDENEIILIDPVVICKL